VLFKSKRGQALVEFALIFPFLFFMLAITIDLFRVDWATTTVAEAARQGARQAIPNADPSDNAFGAALGTCSGMTQTPSANGSGCLTDARIFQTVNAVLGGASIFGGVRDERFGPVEAAATAAGFGFGTSLRVISPWPTVQRLVVIQ